MLVCLPIRIGYGILSVFKKNINYENECCDRKSDPDK